MLEDPREALPRRLPWIALAVVLGLAALAARLLHLQLWNGPVYQREANLNMIHVVPVPAPRGEIVDLDGRVLARSVPRFNIILKPSELSNPTRAMAEVARLLQMKPERVRKLMEQYSASPAEGIVLEETLDPETLARVAEIQGDFPGIRLEAHPLRDYPLGATACHLLGYLGEVDEQTLERFPSRGYYRGEWVGKDGLEGVYDRFLRGRPGSRAIQVDAAGRPAGTVDEVPPRPGATVRLTLDLELQQAAEKSLAGTLAELKERNAEPPAGAVVVLDARSGRVRSLVSLPGFDPNWYAQGISADRFSSLLADPQSPLINRAIAGAFPPASTFKLVTTSAALAEGVASTGSSFYCPGYRMVGMVRFNCFVTYGHGYLDIVDSLGYSCDTTYYQLGTQLGIERLRRYAAAFGIGRQAGIDLPGETPGLLPGPEWKRETLGEEWYAGDDANLAIGQGFLAVTPLQMAVVTAAVANGGTVYRPYLVERVESSAGEWVRHYAPRAVGRVPVRESDLRVVRRGMEKAVAEGTATSARLDGLALAGKTGTVESMPSGENPKGLNHTWFTCYAPAGDPEVVITVFLERSGRYGGELAAPIARDVALAWWRERKKETRAHSNKRFVGLRAAWN